MKTFFLYLILALGISFPTDFLKSDIESSSPAWGFTKLTVKGERDNHLSIPMEPHAIMIRQIIGVASNAVLMNGASLVPSQFSQAPGSSNFAHRLEFVSGDLKGVKYRILDNTLDRVILSTQGDDLNQHRRGVVKLGDRVQIRPCWSLGSVLGTTTNDLALTPITSLPAPGTPINGDGVFIPNQAMIGIDKNPAETFYYVKNKGWRSPGDSSTDRQKAPLEPGMPFRVSRRSAGDEQIIVLGNVPREDYVINFPGTPSNQNDIWISYPYPEPITLGASGLVTSNSVTQTFNISTNSFLRGDELLMFNPERRGMDRPEEATFYYLNNGWRQLGLSISNVVDQQILEPERAYLLRKAPQSPSTDWVITPPY
jgi:uncharacterized protein (TIGR02597 family)